LDPKNYPTIYPESKTNSQIKPDVIILEKIINRAKMELKNRDVNPPEKLIPFGAVGKWQGIDVTIDRYDFDGKIIFKVASPKDWDALYKLNAHNGVSPDKLNPDDFMLIKK